MNKVERSIKSRRCWRLAGVEDEQDAGIMIKPVSSNTETSEEMVRLGLIGYGIESDHSRETKHLCSLRESDMRRDVILVVDEDGAIRASSYEKLRVGGIRSEGSGGASANMLDVHSRHRSPDLNAIEHAWDWCRPQMIADHGDESRRNRMTVVVDTDRGCPNVIEV